MLSGRVTVGALKWSHKCCKYAANIACCCRGGSRTPVWVVSGGERSVKAVLISPAELQAFADHMRDESLPYFLATPERRSRSVAHCHAQNFDLDHKYQNERQVE